MTQAVRPVTTRTPMVTVVIPCFNYGHLLPACVASVLEQPGVGLEVLIVDDASTDGSGEVADGLATADPRVRVIRHTRNTGHIATYNDGLGAAQGDYVVLLSADDLLTPGSLERATALLEAHPGVGFVYGHAIRFSDSPPRARTEPSAWVIWSGRDWLSKRFALARNCIYSPEVVMRTGVQHEIGGYRPELPDTGDLEMWLRAASVADVAYVAGVDQAFYRVHAKNMHSAIFQNGTAAGMAVDLRERMRAFEFAADYIGRDDAGSERLLSSARRAIATEALTLAIRSFHWGIAETWPVDDLAAVALEAYPQARDLVHWRALSLQRRIGAGRTRRIRRNPLSMSHEIALRAQGAARQWRWARAGL